MEFAGGQVSTEISVQEFNLGSLDLDDQHISFVIPEQLAGLPANMLDLTIKYSDVVKEGLAFSMDLAIDTPLPEGIRNVSEVYLDSELECTFSVSDGTMYVSEGFEFSFPEFINLSAKGTSADYEVVDNHVVRFVKDAVLSSTSPLSLDLSFNRIDIAEKNLFSAADGSKKVHLTDAVDVKGDFYIKTKDFTVLPDDIDIAIKVAFEDMDVTKAMAEIDLGAELSGEDVAIDELPEILKGDGICIDLYNPVIGLAITNHSPFDFSIDADITSYTATGAHDVHLGSHGINNDRYVIVPSSSTKDYHFSRRPLATVPQGVSNVVVPAIGELIKELPDRISIHDLEVSVENGLTMVETGSSYDASVAYDLSAPLAFGEDLYLSVKQDVELNLEMGVKISTAKVSLDITNSIPVDFDIDAVCLDAYGNEVTATRVSIDKTIAAGSVDKPTVTPVVLSIDNSLDKLEIRSLRLTMNATSVNPEFQGVCLNRNQGLEIKNIVLALPGGIGVEIN